MLTSALSLLAPWASGLGTGLGLFAAVGAQSAFILRQGVRRSHVASVLAVCLGLDALCIFGSVMAWRTLAAWAPWIMPVVTWGGVAFLAGYAARSAWRAMGSGGALSAVAQGPDTQGAAMLAALGFTVINPHFWLDISLVGSLAQSFGDNAAAYAAGVTTASAVWLLALGGGARLLGPLFRNPRAWRILDGSMAVVLAALALRLAVRAI